ncbi:BTB/POZ domain-containing protein [Aspergillus stella-maris]|uniref:BTB/POZ domain-containing protein n=1 Tax=Aspergillus stella-maris TaxID=1810926 RepID=UPI003CCCF29F
MDKALGKLTLSAGIARIIIGPDQVPFDVHLELLCNTSPYFNHIYEDRTESIVSEVPFTFQDADPDVFAEAISWMYRGTLSGDLATRPGDHAMTFCMELWVLAEKLEIPTLQNQVIAICKARVDKCALTSLPNHGTIEYVYSHTEPRSPPRRLLVDVWVRRGTSLIFSDRKMGFPPAFLEDLCEAMLKCVRGENTFLPPPPLTEYYVDNPETETGTEKCPTTPAPATQAGDRDIPRLATPTQMANRRMKSPSPLLSESSRHPSGSPEVTEPSGVPFSSEAVHEFFAGLKIKKMSGTRRWTIAVRSLPPLYLEGDRWKVSGAEST